MMVKLSTVKKMRETGCGSVKTASIHTAEKEQDEIKARFKAQRNSTSKTDKKRRAEKQVKQEQRETVRSVEDREGSCRRQTSFSGSVSVPGKRLVVCCSHIQVLM